MTRIPSRSQPQPILLSAAKATESTLLCVECQPGDSASIHFFGSLLAFLVISSWAAANPIVTQASRRRSAAIPISATPGENAPSPSANPSSCLFLPHFPLQNPQIP
ncbi:hypothetical protein EJB05_33732, partial [Eragrostis curvula]